ncbi:MAG: histidinol-phosphatase HisJ family protein [Clostridia bacterium]|nr:histidinol-phosphatase HisJ family protein [Clostridia bacterium]
MKKFLTDLHTHSRFSFDGETELDKMCAAAYQKGAAFYGVSEHLDYDLIERGAYEMINADEYFHAARHLQEDYAGAMNLLIGVEFGFSDEPSIAEKYCGFYEKYRPDYVINSVHTLKGEDYYNQTPYFKKSGDRGEKSKAQAYREYFESVRASLDAPYPYDIVGHIGYCTRYAPYEDRAATLAEFQSEIDGILKRIIELEKILELNSSNKGGVSPFLPSREILERYFALGGRKVSFGSDAHYVSRVMDKWEEAIALLKEIGFTYLTVPCRGEHIEVEI